MTNIEYRVERTTAIRQLPDDDFERAAAWEVTRVIGGMAWSIGKWDNEASARVAARLLDALSSDELY